MAVGAETKWRLLVLAASVVVVLVSVDAKKYSPGSPKIPVIYSPPPPRPPPPPPPIHVEAAYAPPIQPCYPVTEYVTSIQSVPQQFPIYKTLVERVSLPTYVYETSYVTNVKDVARTVYTTVYRNEREYDTSNVQRTVYSSTVNLIAVPAVETVTNIRLQVDPSTISLTNTVTRASETIINVNSVVTQTQILRPAFTITLPVNYPVVSTTNAYVTITAPVRSTVTITAPYNVALKGPRVTHTLTKTEDHFTPVFVTETIFITRGATVTEREPVPYTVTVGAPCGGTAVLGGAAIVGGGGGGIGLRAGGGGGGGFGGGFGLGGGGGGSSLGGGGGGLGGGFRLGGGGDDSSSENSEEDSED